MFRVGIDVRSQAIDALVVLSFISQQETTKIMTFLKSLKGTVLAEAALRGWGVLATLVPASEHDELFVSCVANSLALRPDPLSQKYL